MELYRFIKLDRNACCQARCWCWPHCPLQTKRCPNFPASKSYSESYGQMHRFVVKLCRLAQNASPARSHAAALFFGGGMPEDGLVETPAPMLPSSNVSSHPGPCALATRSATTCCTAAVQATMLFSAQHLRIVSLWRFFKQILIADSTCKTTSRASTLKFSDLPSTGWEINIDTLIWIMVWSHSEVDLGCTTCCTCKPVWSCHELWLKWQLILQSPCS